MKTFASALLAATALGLNIQDFETEGTYVITRDRTVNFYVLTLSSDQGTDSAQTTATTTSDNVARYGKIEYKHKLTTGATARTITSVTTLTALNVTKSSGATGAGAANPTTDVGFDMSACFKNGSTTAADLSGMTCWVMSLDKPTTAATGASPWGNGMYDLTVYLFTTDSGVTLTTGDIVWAAGAGPTNGGPQSTTTQFSTAAKFDAKVKLTSNNLASAASGTDTVNTIATNEFVSATNSLSPTTIITGNVPSVAFVHASLTLFTSITGTFTYATPADSSLFQTNGPIWSAQMRSFSQSTALMIFGFRW